MDVDAETPIDADADAVGDEQVDADSDADLQRAIALSLAEFEANAGTPATAASPKACDVQGPDPNDCTPSLSAPPQAATSSASATPPAPPPPQPTPTPPQSARGGPNSWLGALHAERLARRGGAPAPAPRGASPPPKAARTFSGDTFYLNRLACAGAARCPHTVTFEELVDKAHLQSGIFTTFCFDPEFLLPRVRRATPVTIVKHWAPPEERAGHFLVRENVTCLHPRLDRFQSMHAKLYVLLFPAFVRVVVTSANLTQGDYEGVLQNFWAQDFPRKAARATPAGGGRGLGAGFRRELYAFLEQLPLNPKFLDAYDLEAARVELVASVPGRYARDDRGRYGCLRIAGLLRKYSVTAAPGAASDGLCAGLRAQPLWHHVSSLGSLTQKWLDWYAAALRDGPGAAGVAIVFPSDATARATGDARNGCGVICCSRKAYEAAAFPRGALHHFINAGPAARTTHLSHCKVLLQATPTPEGPGSHFGWAVVGSHNLSAGALGRPEKDGAQVHIGNWELSVFFPPAALTLCQDGAGPTAMPVPFRCPPPAYRAGDTPFLDFGK